MSLLERHLLSARVLDALSGEETVTPIELRIDPLTGHGSRILPDRGLMPSSDFDLEAFAATNQATCPFCPERIERLTPRWPAAIAPEGRITRGEALLFPNLHAYATYSSVSVYSPHLHYLPLAAISEALLADNLTTQVDFARAVMATDAAAVWASINANHMLPSGSSLFHPHLQGIVDHHPTTLQRQLAAVPGERFSAYLEAERRAGERHLGNTGAVEWLASFAPIAPAELRAFLPACASPAELDGSLVAELAHGLALALGAYAELGFESFNLALYGAPPATAGYPLNLRVAVRSNLRPLYRSDSSFLERLHWEGAIDIAPERVAELIGDRFRR
jgi:UDPglucose--hexose-1-phosphate uridylyltransferase